MNNKKIVKKLVLKKSIERFINKSLIAAIILLCTMIIIKKEAKYKDIIRENIYEKNFNLIKTRELYNKYLGNIIPIKNIIKEETPVFNEKLNYNKKEPIQDGVKLYVDNSYLVPCIESGVIVYVGEREELGKVIIVEQVNGVACIYSNIDFIDVKLYDYIEKGNLIGEAIENEIILKFAKEGKYIDYQKYI